MYKLFFIAKNNMKKQKGDMITLLILTFISAFLIFYCATTLAGMGRVMDDRFAKINGAHELLFVGNSDEEKECADKAFDENEHIVDYEATPCTITYAEYRNKKDSEWKEYQFITESFEQDKKMMKVLDVDASKLSDDDIFVPFFLKGSFAIGDTLQMKLNDKIYDFVQEPLTDGGYVQGHMLWIIDNTEHYKNVEKIHELAIRDALTGLYNRNYFQEIVEADLEDEEPGTFVMIDMDNFKKVNDENGHQCGDAVLIALSEILKEIPETEMFCSRIGGDEFCAYIRRCVDKEKIAKILDKLMDDFEKRLKNMKYEGITSLSIGAVPSDKISGVSFKALYSESDKVLYSAKLAGKKQYVIK